MQLYINQDIVVVNNPFENTIFTYDRKKHIKSIINEDMFDMLDYIYQHEGITLEKLIEYYEDIEDIIEQLIDLSIIKKNKQKRCHNIKNYKNLILHDFL